MQEIARFLRADSPFMNMRPLRYSYAFDPPPDTLRTMPTTIKKRGLVLSDTILCSYYPNEVMLPHLPCIHLLMPVLHCSFGWWWRVSTEEVRK